MTSLRRGQPVKQYDLVTAGYVLCELGSEEERRRAVEGLWQRTRHMLVLMEPGTPSGSAIVRAARQQVLDVGNSKKVTCSASPACDCASQGQMVADCSHVEHACPFHSGACYAVLRLLTCVHLEGQDVC